MSNFSDFLNLEKNISNNNIDINFNFESIEDLKNYVNNLVTNSNSKDPFWDDMAKTLLLAIICFQCDIEPKEKQNLNSSLDIIIQSINSINDECYLTKLIATLPIDHVASMYYKAISIMPPKTFRSVFEHTKEILIQVLNNSNNDTNTSSDN